MQLAAVRAADRVSPQVAARLALRAFATPTRHPRPATEARVLASADPLVLDVAGRELRAWRWGERGAPVALLVHGWSGRGGQLVRLVPALLDRRFQVVTFDLPGHGDSPGDELTLVPAAEIVREVGRRIGEPELVVAHSFGAAATTIALARGLRVGRVAYVAPMFGVAAAVDRFVRFLGLSRFAHDEFLAALTAASGGSRPEELDGAVLAPGMTAPLLVVHDRDDREVPYADALDAARAWPDARLVTTVGLGHRRLLDDADVIAAIAGFAAGTAPHLTLLDEAVRIERDLVDREGRRARAFP